jgi:hypothetical protein
MPDLVFDGGASAPLIGLQLAKAAREIACVHDGGALRVGELASAPVR